MGLTSPTLKLAVSGCSLQCLQPGCQPYLHQVGGNKSLQMYILWNRASVRCTGFRGRLTKIVAGKAERADRDCQAWALRGLVPGVHREVMTEHREVIDRGSRSREL